MSVHGGQERYREADVRSASPEKLVVMLYDKMIRDIEEAAGDPGRAVDRAHHALAIATELADSLDTGHDPELAGNLSSLYAYVGGQLRGFLGDRRVSRLEDCLKVLTPLRDAWREAASGTSESAGATAAERAEHLFSVSV